MEDRETEIREMDKFDDIGKEIAQSLRDLKSDTASEMATIDIWDVLIMAHENKQ